MADPADWLRPEEVGVSLDPAGNNGLLILFPMVDSGRGYFNRYLKSEQMVKMVK